MWMGRGAPANSARGDAGIYAPASGSVRAGSVTAGGSIAPGQKRSILHYRNLVVRWMAVACMCVCVCVCVCVFRV